MGGLQQAGFPFWGSAGKGVWAVTEELRGEELIGNRVAVNMDKGPPVGRAVPLDICSQMILPRAAFSINQDRGIVLCQQIRLLINLNHGGT